MNENDLDISSFQKKRLYLNLAVTRLTLPSYLKIYSTRIKKKKNPVIPFSVDDVSHRDRNRWRTLVHAVMNLRAPYDAENFLTHSKPVSFARRTLLHGVSME